ncbi:type II secretion system protein [bacterium]|nr:type II secretion system protein [bacterium]
MKNRFTLAEGPRRTGDSATNFGKTLRLWDSAGFTLAEVLITLGIIGVVSAMTIPTLMTNIRGQQYRGQFKKTLSTLNQAVRMNKANYDFDFADLEDVQCGERNKVNGHAEWVNIANDNPEVNKTVCAIFNGNLKGASYIQPEMEYFENVKSDYLDETYRGLVTADGSIIFFSEGLGLNHGNWDTGCYYDSNGQINDDFNCIGFIDVNGTTLPNKEVQCSNEDTELLKKEPCIVKSKDMGDIFPVVFHDATVEPASNAAMYVLNTAK